MTSARKAASLAALFALAARERLGTLSLSFAVAGVLAVMLLILSVHVDFRHPQKLPDNPHAAVLARGVERRFSFRVWGFVACVYHVGDVGLLQEASYRCQIATSSRLVQRVVVFHCNLFITFSSIFGL